jgi:hypothetical protein
MLRRFGLSVSHQNRPRGPQSRQRPAPKPLLRHRAEQDNCGRNQRGVRTAFGAAAARLAATLFGEILAGSRKEIRYDEARVRKVEHKQPSDDIRATGTVDIKSISVNTYIGMLLPQIQKSHSFVSSGAEWYEFQSREATP